VGGVFFLGFGLLPTLVLNLTGLAFCVNNAMHPKLLISDEPLDGTVTGLEIEPTKKEDEHE
jgi:hypothetical protein